MSPIVVPMSERDWQSEVIEVAGVGGWSHYHTHDSRRSARGFPDLVFARPGEVLYAELKSEVGKLSEDQVAWIELLRSAGQEVYVWRPSHRAEVERVLLRPRRAWVRPAHDPQEEGSAGPRRAGPGAARRRPAGRGPRA